MVVGGKAERVTSRHASRRRGRVRAYFLAIQRSPTPPLALKIEGIILAYCISISMEFGSRGTTGRYRNNTNKVQKRSE